MDAEERKQALRVAFDLRGHLQWLADAGATALPRPPESPAAPSASQRTIDEGRPAMRATGASAPGSSLPQIREEIGDCKRCKLHSGRTKLVFGVGNPKAELLFVGEGPGADEDRVGEPFVGKAGQLLDRMILAMGMHRGDVYICNVVKCRPPGNRNPEPDEIASCLPFLHKQIEAVGPKVVVALGKFAAQTLLNDLTPITRLRGRWRELGGRPFMPTFHPAYLLRNPAEKAKVWEDLKAVVKALGRELPKGGSAES